MTTLGRKEYSNRIKELVPCVKSREVFGVNCFLSMHAFVCVCFESPSLHCGNSKQDQGVSKLLFVVCLLLL